MMMMTMTKALLLVACLTAFADARTTVAVVELGKSGTVRRTTSKNSRTTVAGVASFWSSLHGSKSTNSFAHTGHTVVPDLFTKADSGVVLELSNVDLAVMPTVHNLVEDHDRVVGHLDLEGALGRPLLNKVGIAEEATVSSLHTVARAKSQKEGLSAMRLRVNEDNASEVDTNVASLLQTLHKEALEQDRTIVLHVVVEEEEGASRRGAAIRRRLEEEGDREGEEGEGEEGNASGDNTEDGEGKNGYYGYGYYNSYGEWVTPYKTMFQIQYFNVVLWTAIVLFLVLSFAIYLVIHMPLEADTLLFGESAKMMSD